MGTKRETLARTMVTAMPKEPSMGAGVLQPALQPPDLCRLPEHLSPPLYVCLLGLRLKILSGIVRVAKLDHVLLPLLAIRVI